MRGSESGSRARPTNARQLGRTGAGRTPQWASRRWPGAAAVGSRRRRGPRGTRSRERALRGRWHRHRRGRRHGRRTWHRGCSVPSRRAASGRDGAGHGQSQSSPRGLRLSLVLQGFLDAGMSRTNQRSRPDRLKNPLRPELSRPVGHMDHTCAAITALALATFDYLSLPSELNGLFEHQGENCAIGGLVCWTTP